MAAIVTPQIEPLNRPAPHWGLSWAVSRFDVIRIALFAVILLGLVLSVVG